MLGSIIQCSSLLGNLNYLKERGKNGDKVCDLNGVALAEKISEKVVLLECRNKLDLDLKCNVIKGNVNKSSIEIGDLLYLQDGSVLRAIIKNDKVDHKDTFSLEVVITNGIKNGFKPLPLCWKEDFSYGVSGYLDIIKVRKLDGTIEKTDMWYKHLNESKKKISKITLLGEPSKILSDKDNILFYETNGFLYVSSGDLEEHVNVYGNKTFNCETISLNAVDNFYTREEN